MPSALRPDLLFARLQLRAPSARSILLTSPRGGSTDSQLASALAAAIVAAGDRTRLLDLTNRSDGAAPPEGVERMEVLQAELNDPERARRALQWPNGFTIIAAGGVLESAPAVMLSATADVVVLVARQGRTMRADLLQARDEIEGAGGVVVGSVLLD